MHQNKNNSIVIEEQLVSIRGLLQSARQIQYMVNCYFCFQAKNKYILPARESVKSMLVWGWALEQDHQRQAANRDSMRRRMSKDGVCITANIFILVRNFCFQFNKIFVGIGNLFIYTLIFECCNLIEDCHARLLVFGASMMVFFLPYCVLGVGAIMMGFMTKHAEKMHCKLVCYQGGIKTCRNDIVIKIVQKLYLKCFIDNEFGKTIYINMQILKC